MALPLALLWWAGLVMWIDKAVYMCLVWFEGWGDFSWALNALNPGEAGLFLSLKERADFEFFLCWVRS